MELHPRSIRGKNRRAGSFDARASNHVPEHVELPKLHLREAARALMPGGVYCFRTPNLWHYVTFAPRRDHSMGAVIRCCSTR
jgi:2-polyprenyl-3-methyl-5-hydroxy-6-metoxy-1,4-benzoquinol methylase